MLFIIVMKYFLHILKTWFIAVMITDMIIVTTNVVDEFNAFQIGVADLIWLFFVIYIFGSFISLPTLLIAFFFLTILISLNVSAIEKAFLWFLLVFISILLTIIAYGFFFDNTIIGPKDIIEMWPIFLGTFLALSSRLNIFFNLIHKTQDDGNF